MIPMLKEGGNSQMRASRERYLTIASLALLTLALSACPVLADATVSCTVEQNGKNAKITCTVCPGTSSDFTGATSSDPNVVAVQSTTKSNETINGEACGKIIVQVVKKKEGSETVTVTNGVGLPNDVDFALTKDLFSMAVPGGAGFGETEPSTIKVGETWLVSLKMIDTVSGADANTVNGTATATLIGPSGFRFDNGLQARAVVFSGGVASLRLVGGPMRGTAYLEISDDATAGSVDGASVVHTARIELTAGEVIPALSQWGLILLAGLVLIGGTLMIMRRRAGSAAA